MKHSLNLTKVTKDDIAAAQAAVDAAQAVGAGSNRTNWLRVLTLIGACEAVTARGGAVEVSKFFTPAPGGASPYHLAHRALSSAAVRPYWKHVKIVALKDCKNKKGAVEGESTTTGHAARVFVVAV